ncbi:MAG: NFACT family protein [Clostridia bacterium]|nr:NFACT family protein [Clostridia bacterium]
MPQDAITLSKTVNELNSFFQGARVNKIMQPTADEIILSVHGKYGNAKISVCTNAVGTRVGITNQEKRNPQVPTGFCMLLRKHLQSAIITNICTIPGERIVKFTFDGKNDFLESVEKQMYCEIMGKYSNTIFCENEIILATQKSSALEIGKERALLTGAKYALPKSQGKQDIFNKTEFFNTINNFTFGDLSEFIFNNFQGVSLPTAKEIVYRFFGKTMFDSQIIKIDDFFEFIFDFLNNYNEKPCVVKCEKKLLDFYFCDYKTVSGEKIFFNCITDAETYFYDTKDEQRAFDDYKNKLLSSVNSKYKKEVKKLQIIADKELACDGADVQRKFGELITANIYKINRGDKFVIVDDYYNENKPLKISLDEQLSPTANAQKYFKKYAKLKNTLKAIIPQKEQCKAECEYLKSVIVELNIAQNINDLEEIESELLQSGLIKGQENKNNNKKVEKISYREFNYLGYKILAGKNNLQNDKLTGSAKPNDMWIHTKDYHSAHVIIQSSSAHLPNEVLQIACEICAFYSEAKNGDKVPVDYTLKKYVKKPPKSKYGAVIYTDFKTVYVTPNSHKNLEI